MTSKKKYFLFPIEHQDLFKRYESARDQFWVTGEVDLSKDKYEQLTNNEKRVLKLILSFFAASDLIVNENILDGLLPNIKENEAKFYYDFQVMMEDIHSHMYSLFLETYIKNQKEKEELFNGIENIETVKHKAEWALKWLNKDRSFEERLIAFSLVEGMMFSSLFAFVFYFRDGGLMPGLCKGNNLIMKDENNHYEFAVNYYKNYSNKIDSKIIRDMILDAYNVEVKFCEEVLEFELPGLTKNIMINYLKYVTDTILVDYNLPKEFNVSQPIDYMTRIMMDTRSNFFEHLPDSYTRIQISENKFDEDF